MAGGMEFAFFSGSEFSNFGARNLAKIALLPSERKNLHFKFAQIKKCKRKCKCKFGKN